MSSNNTKGCSIRRLVTVRQLTELTEAFSTGSIRWLIFNAHENGLEEALVRIGRRVYIDVDRFNGWLDSQRGGAQ